jgi:DNA-directed RNA polymerase specialized sigma24 family protein
MSGELPGNGPDDDGLLHLAKTGDHAAWSGLCRRHAAPLAAYLGARLRRPAVVDQLVGETLVAAWANLSECADGAAFPAFLRRAGATVAMKWAKDHPQEAIDEPFPADRLPASMVEDVKGVTRLHGILATLGEQHRMIIELHWRGGLEGESLASAMRMTPAAADGLLAEAEAALLGQLAG